jgi:hypothetical protein
VKQRSTLSARQTLRTTPAPDGLEAWLDAVNGLPGDELCPIPGGAPPPLWLISDGGVPSLWLARTNNAESERAQKVRELRKRTADWGRPTVAYIFREDTGTPEPGERLSELVSAWITFRHIAELAGSPQAFDRVVTVTNPPGAGARLIADHGVLKVEVSPLFKMLDGIEADRIRVCPICQNLYWAGRRDKSACSGQCSGTFRQRRLRENRARAKRKHQRREKHP